MTTVQTPISEVLIFEPKVFGDARGFFFESFNEKEFQKAGVATNFVQDNHSRSSKNVLRGLHYQISHPQGKLIRVVRGEVFDVAVDLRRSSRTFGKWVSAVLSEDNKRILWIPPGFAHGFLACSDIVDFLYKTTDFYSPADERTLMWNDPELAINWPLRGNPIVSRKDEQGSNLRDAECFA